MKMFKNISRFSIGDLICDSSFKSPIYGIVTSKAEEIEDFARYHNEPYIIVFWLPSNEEGFNQEEEKIAHDEPCLKRFEILS